MPKGQMKYQQQAANPRGNVSRSVQNVLASRYLPIALATLALVLTLPSLGVGWITDDLLHRAAILGTGPLGELSNSSIDIFRFLDGDPQRTSRLMDLGVLPWWSFLEMKGAFWRPLTALTHLLDYRLWPESPVLMHAHSLLWFGALVGATALLYRRIMGLTWLAGLAALLYAIDDAHGMPVGFLANRNALLATLFGVLALLAHDRWRRDGRWMGAVAGPLLFVISLLSAEAGIATCAYLAAHALCIDRSTWRQRCLALLPYVAIVLVWRIAWTYQGYGISGEPFAYVDPLADPMLFATAALKRAPILLLAQWALPPSDFAMMIGSRGMLLWSLGASVVLVLLAVVLFPVLRQDRLARFWALGMLLSVLPICAPFPMDRLLFFVGIGAMGLLAQFLQVAFGQPAWRPNVVAWRAPAVFLGAVFVLMHLVVAPIALPLRAAYPMGPKWVLRRLEVQTPTDASIEQQDLVIVNSPCPLYAAAYSLIIRDLNAQPIPRHTWALASGLPAIVVHRTDARTLVIRPEHGYLSQPHEWFLRSDRHPMSLGQRVELTGMTVEVTSLTDDGRPAEATFTFDVALEDSSLRWLQWNDGEYIPFTPPAVGESVELRPKHLQWGWPR